MAEAKQKRRVRPTKAMILERERQIWNYITVRGWTQKRVAEHLGLAQSYVSKKMRELSRRVDKELDEAVIVQKQKQLGILEQALEEVLEAWTASKDGQKTVGRTTVKETVGGSADGKVPGDVVRETVTSQQSMRDSAGNVAYLAEARALMSDIRKLMGFGDEVKVNLSWQSMLPVGYEPDNVAWQFAELLKLDDGVIDGNATNADA